MRNDWHKKTLADVLHDSLHHVEKMEQWQVCISPAASRAASSISRMLDWFAGASIFHYESICEYNRRSVSRNE